MAPATSSRSRGTTPGCWRSFARRSRLSQALRKGQRLEAENSLLRGEGMPKVVAESPAMQNVLQVISRSRALGRERPRARRERHRQGRRRARAARGVEPGVAADGGRQFRRRVGRRVRERALRTRSRRLHGRQGRPRRPLRARRSGHALPRRDRQRAAQPAEQAAARHRNGRVRAPRLVANSPRRCPHHLGDEREHPGRSRRQAASGRICSSA